MADHVEHAPAVQASADGHPAKRARVEDDDGHPGVHSAVSNVRHRCGVQSSCTIACDANGRRVRTIVDDLMMAHRAHR